MDSIKFDGSNVLVIRLKDWSYDESLQSNSNCQVAGFQKDFSTKTLSSILVCANRDLHPAHIKLDSAYKIHSICPQFIPLRSQYFVHVCDPQSPPQYDISARAGKDNFAPAHHMTLDEGVWPTSRPRGITSAEQSTGTH